MDIEQTSPATPPASADGQSWPIASAAGVFPDGLPLPQRYWSMLAIGIGMTMSVLDSAVANVALPAIARELGATPANSIWIITSYQLAIVVSLLPVAALGERVGYRRVYQVGIAVLTVGSLLCALSHSLTGLVTARTLQGFGAAGIMAVNGALVRFTYPHASLGRGVGLNALVVSAAAALGPTVASAILSLGSWEWLFAVNVPFGLFNLVLAWRALPYSERTGRLPDGLSTALNALVFGLFFIGAEALAHGGGGGFAAVAELLVALAAGVVLFRREAGRDKPLVPIDLLRIPLFGLSYLLNPPVSRSARYAVDVSTPGLIQAVGDPAS
jgi:DHA2 family multidrug resistance protein-like MFS transporter